MDPYLKNRIHNSTNPWQGKAKKVLCVCSAGLLRSPTAANTLHKKYGFNTRAAGLTKEYALIHVDEVLLHWADEIVCMDSIQHSVLSDMTDTPVFNLNIPDNYGFMEDDLCEMIIEAYENRYMKA